ncbi:MAG: hypothetical protein IH951_15895 [Bacteroidetes bacterium]|nr:hypothetical protein [Bacteroidota bacterium]
MGFALADGVEWIALEAAGVGLFVLLAYAGLRHSPLLLALGWTVHVGWDVGLHLARQQVVVPAWYPSACISFDLLVAGYVVWTVWATRSRSTSEPSTKHRC